MAALRGPIFLPDLVLTEAAQLVVSRIGSIAEAHFIRGIAASGVVVIHTEHEDLVRIAELLEIYSDQRLGTVDAAVVALAERLGVTTIATLDHRHFAPIRPRHAPRFELVP